MNGTGSREAIRAAGIEAAIVAERPLGGGCIADVRRIGLEDGRSLVVKIGPPGRASEEASGLRAISAAGSLPAPEVLGLAELESRSVLVLEDLGDAARPQEAAWVEFGRRLADLHAHPAGEVFGFDTDHHLGDTPESNGPSSEPSSWFSFWRERRLEPMRSTLEGRGELDAEDHRRLDRLVVTAESVLPDVIRPGLIHGDLWSGNAHPTTSRGIAVIDPAAFRADPLFEIGMMRLFGGFPVSCERAYLDRLRERLGPDAMEAAEFRIELGRLHHVLNHWLLFGAGYASQARRLADELSRASSRTRP